MIVRRFRFPDHGNFSIDAYPAIVGVNEPFTEACREKLPALSLYAEIDRSNATSERVLAEIYADTVIVGSIDPRLSGLDRDGWVSWLVGNEPVFSLLRGATAEPSAFEDA